MTTPATYNVLGIGNAMVDILATATEDFLASQSRIYGMKRGSMNLINEARAIELYSQMGPGTEMSGGSAGNTIAHVAALGARAAFMGKVADDQLGEVFRHDLKSMGVDYRTSPLLFGAHTGRCMILVADDASRTMNTYLGAGTELRPEDIEPDMIAAAAVTYLEGYLFDADHSKQAFYLAASTAGLAGRQVALTLSDSFCVERHREDFLRLINEHVDILFANEHEIKSLARTDDLTAAINSVRDQVAIAAITQGPSGSTVIASDQTIQVPAVAPSALVDTTGAGDAYAAGFLTAYTRGQDFAACGQLGSQTASSVLSYMGPRPVKKAA